MSRSTRSRLRCVALALAFGSAGSVVVATAAAAQPSTGVVISEVYGGGGNSGATYRQDFIDLQNRGAAAVDVTGWSVQYHSSSPAGTWQATMLTGSIAPGGYLVAVEGRGANCSEDVPGQVTGTTLMSASSGTVARVSSPNALPCSTSADCNGSSVDLVGYGGAPIAEGTAVAGADNTHSVSRVAEADTDSNVTDLVVSPPTPGADNILPPPGPPAVRGDVRVHDIQGAGFVSPLKDQSVTNVPGIVTAVRTSGSSRGYFVQDPTPDGDPATSEGVFVFTSAPAVAVGDSVLVSGKVQDYYPDGNPTVAQALSITEIASSGVVVLSHGNTLPAAELLTATSVPDLYAPDLGGASIETTPITQARSALDFWESREGMRVQVDNARVVGPTDSYGEQYVTTKPDQKPTCRGGTLLTAENATPSGRLEIVPVTANRPVSVGDVYAGATVGPVDYSRFGGYLIAATQLGTVVSGGLKPVLATTPTARDLSVATYNVQNLAPGDPQSKFDALATGIVHSLAAPDIVAVEEIQDNTGAADDGVVAADRTVARLTAAVVAAGGPQYTSRGIDPADDQDGGQPGGNIRNVFLFNPARVDFLDRGAADVNRTTTATAVTGFRGQTTLTLSPGRIDPTNPAWTSSRKPLVGQFRFRGQPVFVIANHFNSKGGDGNADGRYQYPTRSSEVQRQQQGALVHTFVLQLLQRNPLAQAVVLGDLNDYQFSPALKVLETGRADGRALADPDRPDPDAAGRPAVHLRLPGDLAGARPHPAHAGNVSDGSGRLPGDSHQCRVRRPDQ